MVEHTGVEGFTTTAVGSGTNPPGVGGPAGVTKTPFVENVGRGVGVSVDGTVNVTVGVRVGVLLGGSVGVISTKLDSVVVGIAVEAAIVEANTIRVEGVGLSTRVESISVGASVLSCMSTGPLFSGA